MLVGGAAHTAATLRGGRSPAERWARHTRLAQLLLWVALLVGLPTALAAAYVNGAGLFCF